MSAPTTKRWPSKPKAKGIEAEELQATITIEQQDESVQPDDWRDLLIGVTLPIILGAFMLVGMYTVSVKAWNIFFGSDDESGFYQEDVIHRSFEFQRLPDGSKIRLDKYGRVVEYSGSNRTVDDACQTIEGGELVKGDPILIVGKNCYVDGQIGLKVQEITAQQALEQEQTELAKIELGLIAEDRGVLADDSWRELAVEFAVTSTLPMAYEAAELVYIEHGGEALHFYIDVEEASETGEFSSSQGLPQSSLSRPSPTYDTICGPDNDIVQLPNVNGITYTSSGWDNGKLEVTAGPSERGFDYKWEFIDENVPCEPQDVQSPQAP